MWANSAAPLDDASRHKPSVASADLTKPLHIHNLYLILTDLT